MPDFWTVLRQKVQYVRGLYSRYRIPLKPGEGLARALAEAESLSQAERPAAVLNEADVTDAVHAAHVVYSLADGLEVCVNAGLDVSNHLKQSTTGSIDYGTPDLSGGQSIYFKDFECELFIAACLVRRGLAVQFLDQPSDPRGDLRLDDFFIEVKHPNSTGQLTKLLRKFNKSMRENGTYGAFVVGIEDAFNLGDREDFESAEEYKRWLAAKRQGIEADGFEIIRFGLNALQDWRDGADADEGRDCSRADKTVSER